MGESQAHRSNVHPVMLTAELEIALVHLQHEREIGKTYAVLYGLVEGLFRLGYLSREDYDLHIKRYSRKLVDVTKEKRAQRESSHVPVLTLEKQKEKAVLDRKDRQFKGQLAQWNDKHPDPDWHRKALADAQKYPQLESAHALLEMAKKTQKKKTANTVFEPTKP